LAKTIIGKPRSYKLLLLQLPGYSSQ
jgi:hypothetical protein